MTEREKIIKIIAPYVAAYGEDEAIADALIAAGIGDVKDLQAQVNVLEITNIALQAGYDDAEKDRLYWVDKYKEAEHRAEVAEKAFSNCIENFVKFQYEQKSIQLDNVFLDEVIKKCLQQAEKELAEERKDD